MEYPRYAVLLWTVTSGTQGDSMGSDESDTIALGWSVFDLVDHKVVLSQVDYVKPRRVDMNDNIQISEECRTNGITEENIRSAKSLDQVITEFIDLIRTRLDCFSPSDFHLITDGQLHLRQVLHPESVRVNFHLPQPFFSFFDLRKEFKKFYNTDFLPSCLTDMLNYLSVDEIASAEYLPQQLQTMTQIITRMLKDGHTFVEPETISQRLEPGVCSKNEIIDSGCVARTRGLPWHSSDQDIAKFFRGLNITSGGVALCLTSMGRRNGEALIRFVSQEHRDLAMKRHRHHIGQRYIEVYRATGEDFLSVAGGNNDEAYAFLSKGFQVIIRMRGLPYGCTSKQIIEFFGQGSPPIPISGNEEGILLVKKPDGRATGDAFVLFATEESAALALDKHRGNIGSRYVELFRSSTAEVQQVLNRTMDPSPCYQQSFPQTTTPVLSPIPQMVNQHNLSATLLATPPTPQVRKDCVRLRGLPYEAQVEHIVEFLGDHSKNIVWQGVHMVFNSESQPSGEAFIQMNSETSALLCASQKHHRNIVINEKQRYIEVFQCSLDDMLPVFQGLHMQQPHAPSLSSLTSALEKQSTQLRWGTDLTAFGSASALGSAFPTLGSLPGGINRLNYFYPAFPNLAAHNRELSRASLLGALPQFLLPQPMTTMHAASLRLMPTGVLARASPLPLMTDQSVTFPGPYTGAARC